MCCSLLKASLFTLVAKWGEAACQLTLPLALGFVPARGAFCCAYTRVCFCEAGSESCKLRTDLTCCAASLIGTQHSSSPATESMRSRCPSIMFYCTRGSRYYT